MTLINVQKQGGKKITRSMQDVKLSQAWRSLLTLGGGDMPGETREKARPHSTVDAREHIRTRANDKLISIDI